MLLSSIFIYLSPSHVATPYSQAMKVYRWSVLAPLGVYVLASTAGTALAAAPTPAQELNAGHYAQAYTLAQKSGDLLTASSAAFAQINFVSSPSSAAIDQALSAAQAAVQAQPNNVQAHLDLAGVYGIKAAGSGLSIKAYQLSRRARAEIERALALEPRSPRALTALARWHAGVYARAGKLSDGDPNTARTLAAQALPLAGNDISVYVNLATAFQNLKDSQSARAALTKALAITPQNAMDRAYQQLGKAMMQ